MTAPRHPFWLPWLVAAVLVVGVFALRWPTFGFKVWNVDEAIHAAVARTLLDGGVLYRDAIDQRTPLTYYVVAALFRVGGENNIWAMRALASALIAAAAFGLFLLGRAWRGAGTGLWAALLFAVFSTALFFPGDAYALNTEWFVAVFTTWAAWAFSRGAPTAAGALLGLAFLSKQPALLDLGAPLAVLACGAWQQGGRVTRFAARAGLLLAGFAVPVGLAAAYFAAHGALADGWFYAWHYNLQYYGPEISTPDRVLSALIPLDLLGRHYPLVLAALAGALAFAGFRALQQRPDPAERAENPSLLYLLAWSATSLTGAASGGRGYDHYFIQFLPPACLAAALGLDGIRTWARTHRARRWLHPAALLLLGVVLVQLGLGVVRFRRLPALPVDPSVRAGEFIRAHTAPGERLFVWGYHPDLYLFADRAPASRFVYASFLSGLIPWTNTAPGRDTTYAIVPGARDILLQELEAARPAFIVDCSAGPNRFWHKYPLSTFPELRDFVERHYVLAEPAQFGGQGFQLWLIRDAFRRSPPVLAGGPAAAPPIPQLFAPASAGEAGRVAVSFAGTSADGRLQRLELLHNGAVLAAASFLPTRDLLLQARVTLPDAPEHRLAVRATATSGATATTAEQTLSQESGRLPAARLAEFIVPQADRFLAPARVLAPYGATVETEAGRSVFSAHAPATLSYALSGRAGSLHGHFGIRPGAYATTNPAPTDGAEFLIVAVQPDGTRTTLFHRWLQPAQAAADRGPQPFAVLLPPGPTSTLELVITNGPAGNAASDWTYWSDLLFTTGP